MVPSPVDQERSLVVVKGTGMHESLFKEKADLVMSDGGVMRDAIVYDQEMQVTLQTLLVIFQLVVSAVEEEECLQIIVLEVNLL